MSLLVLIVTSFVIDYRYQRSGAGGTGVYTLSDDFAASQQRQASTNSRPSENGKRVIRGTLESPGYILFLYKSSLLITYALHVPEREIEEAQEGEGEKVDEERASAMEYAFQVTYIVLCYLYPTYLSLR